MQIVSSGDNLHEISDPVFREKLRKNIISLSSAELAQMVVKVKSHWNCHIKTGSLRMPQDML